MCRCWRRWRPRWVTIRFVIGARSGVRSRMLIRPRICRRRRWLWVPPMWSRVRVGGGRSRRQSFIWGFWSRRWRLMRCWSRSGCRPWVGPGGRSTSSTGAPRTGPLSGSPPGGTAPGPGSVWSTWVPPRCWPQRSPRRSPTGPSIAEAAEHAADDTEPHSDLNATSEYRTHLAKTLTRRALTDATT